MNKTNLFLTFALTLFFGAILAQDTIYKTKGDIIVAKISEISPTEIKFKRFDMPDGPLYIELKTNVTKVKYSNGTIDVFKEQPVVTEDYISPEILSNKIEFKGKWYRYKNESYSEKRIQYVLLEKKDEQITNLVNRSRQCRKLQYIGFVGIPFGLVAAFSSYIGLLTYDSGDSSTDGFSQGAIKVASISAVIGCIFPITAIALKAQRKELTLKAVKLYNQKYP